MDFYSLIKLKQPCIICNYYSNSCICNNCETELATTKYRCTSCGVHLEIIKKLQYCGNCLRSSQYYNQVFVVYDYEGWVKSLIGKFKYSKELAIGKFFAKKILIILENLEDYDIIIPMPLHKKRLKERGFNQVMELLREVGKHTIIDYKSCVRTKKTTQLLKLNFLERKKELKNAFKVIKKMHYKKILIVDDVLTTTASIKELSKTIYKSYAKNKPIIDILVLARGVKK